LRGKFFGEEDCAEEVSFCEEVSLGIDALNAVFCNDPRGGEVSFCENPRGGVGPLCVSAPGEVDLFCADPSSERGPPCANVHEDLCGESGPTYFGGSEYAGNDEKGLPSEDFSGGGLQNPSDDETEDGTRTNGGLYGGKG